MVFTCSGKSLALLGISFSKTEDSGPVETCDTHHYEDRGVEDPYRGMDGTILLLV
jgi:hypothetical protein